MHIIACCPMPSSPLDMHVLPAHCAMDSFCGGMEFAPRSLSPAHQLNKFSPPRHLFPSFPGQPPPSFNPMTTRPLDELHSLEDEVLVKLEADAKQDSSPTGSFGRQTPPKEAGTGSRRFIHEACKVCGDDATGMYFGAIVCVPCKTFFLRYAGDNFAFLCKYSKSCEISVATRTQCKFCRYQKCLQAGMCRRERPAQVQISEGQQMCVVCSDIANGVHFGAITCEGCKKFFRRGLQEHSTYSCKSSRDCVINPRTRNSCRFCRYQKCLSAGMSREAIQMGRPAKIKPSLGNARDVQTRPRSSNADPMRSPTPAKCPGRQVGRPHSIQHSVSMPYVSNMEPVPMSAPSGQMTQSDTFPTDHMDEFISDIISSNYAGAKPPRLPPPISQQNSPLPPPPQTPNSLSPVPSSPQQQLMPMNHSNGSFSSNQLLRDDSSEFMRSSKQTRVAELIDELLAQPLANGVAVQSVKQADFFLPSATEPQYEPMQPTSVNDVPSSNADLLSLDSFNESSAEHHDGTHEVEMPCSPTTATVRSLETIANSIGETEAQKEAAPVALFSCLTHLADQLGSDARDSCISSSGSSSSSEPSSWGELDFDRCVRYWRSAPLPDENIMFGEKHLQLIDQIMPAYHRFVATGTSINKRLRQELECKLMEAYFGLDFLPSGGGGPPAAPMNANRAFRLAQCIEFLKWVEHTSPLDVSSTMPQWVNTKVVPVYTLSSVTFCKDLPGFLELNPSDQCTLIRLGQSQSRILVAAMHWFNHNQGNFRDFLCWRTLSPGNEDKFKSRLVEYANIIIKQEIDTIEAALLNALVIVAIDYPGLKNTDRIEQKRLEILHSFRAYTTAKYGTPNTRIEQLFRCIPHLRQLGLLHHKMTLQQQVSESLQGCELIE